MPLINIRPFDKRFQDVLEIEEAIFNEPNLLTHQMMESLPSRDSLWPSAKVLSGGYLVAPSSWTRTVLLLA
jgi:hypothetical protein